MDERDDPQLSMTALVALRDRHFADPREKALFTALIELAERLDRLAQILERGELDTEPGRG